MAHYAYAVVGGGVAASAALAALAEADPGAEVALFSRDLYPPYRRPYLSKALWKGKPLEDVWYPRRSHVAYHLGRSIVAVDVAGHRLTDEDGNTYGYGKLLLATGGTPRTLPEWGDAVATFRDLDDYLALRRAAHPGSEVLVVGGGFIGAELASALAGVGAKVTMVFPEDGVLARILPSALVARLMDVYRRKGVRLLPGETLKAARREGEKVVAVLGSGKEQRFDLAVAGIGIAPALELAEGAGIATGDGGVLVDERLRTSAPDVFAAGDIAAFPSAPLSRRLRVEHEQAAADQGRVAALVMAGREAQLEPLPLFYSDLFDDGFEAVGILDARLEMVIDGEPPYDEAAVYYLEGGRVVGVLLWNLWDKVPLARSLIRESEVRTPEDLRRRLR